MQTLETVEIKNAEHEAGFVIINKSDFDETKHELRDAPAKRGRPPKVQDEKKAE